MKIITNTKREGLLCYVQVKDILFLARITNNKVLMQQYLSLINEGRFDNEFIKITQSSLIDIINKCDYIVDFNELSKSDCTISYLSRLIININYAVPSNDVMKECIDYKTDGIRDVMAFKKGELDYTIPLVANGVLEYTSEDSRYILESTVVPNTFTIRVSDGSEVQNNDYYSFYLEAVDKIFNTMYPELDNNDREFSCVDRGKILIISIKNKTKKKESKLNKLLMKLKKGS